MIRTTATILLLIVSIAAVGARAQGPSDDDGIFDDAWQGAKTLASDTGHILTAPFRMSTADAVELSALVAATGMLLMFDEEITAAANRNAEKFPLKPALEVGRALDPLGYGTMNVYYLGGLGVSYLANWDTGEAMFGQILTSFVVYGLLKRPVEAVVGRQRPYAGEGAYSFGNDDATSFPSGHTINVFQLATVVSHHVDRWWFDVAAFGGAACVGLQRIEADAHYASDVLVSAVFAVATARAAIALSEDRNLSVAPAMVGGAPAVGVSLAF
jgi:hypothetical protein